MRCLVSLGISLIFTVCLFAQEWEWISPLPTNLDIVEIDFVDRENGWLISDNALLMRTRDGGTSWDDQSNNTGSQLRFLCLCMADSLHGWIGCGGGYYLMTQNGGETWNAFNIESLRYIIGIDFVSPENGWLLGWDWDFASVICKTTDGGAEWTRVYENVDTSYVAFDFVDDSTGWIFSDAGEIARTTDGGESWEQQESGAIVEFRASSFFNSEHGLAVGASNQIFCTDDGGQNWFTYDFGMELGFLDAGMTSDTSAWILSQGGIVYKTTDGCENWDTRLADTTHCGTMEVIDDQTVWIAGESGLLYSTTDGGSEWVMRRQGFTESLYDVLFLDTLKGFAVGEHGTIFLTLDGGVSWQSIESGAESNLSEIEFTGDQVGWIIGRDGVILKTTDGGSTWNLQSSGTEYSLLDISVFDESTAWIVGDCGVILLTVDGGETWEQRPVPVGYPIFSVWFHSVTDGIAFSWTDYEGIILKTWNGGQSWHITESSLEFPLAIDALFFDEMNGVIAGYYPAWDAGNPRRGTIQRTNDGGSTWTTIGSGGQHSNFSDIQFVTDSVGWVIGSRSDNGNSFPMVRKTVDRGETWTSSRPAQNRILSAISFPTPNIGWGVGSMGTIMKCTDAVVVSEVSVSAPYPYSFALSAYPNPFNSMTTLAYDIPQAGRVSLQVFDVTGRLVKTLEDRVMPAGAYSNQFEGNHLASGIYFVSLRGNTVSTTKKIVLLK